MFSNCPTLFQSSDCSNPFSSGNAGPGAFGLYVRAILAALGAVILMGPGVARLVGRLKGSGSDSERPSGLGC